MHPSFLRLAARALWRDLRAGELRLLVLAVALAVAALSAVAFLAGRLQAGLERDARQLLGGDAVLVADALPPAAFAAQAAALGLATSLSATFPTMARAPDAQGGASRLVALKAVDAAYPLRGTLRTAPAAGTPDAPTAGGPAPGSVWADAAVLESLGLRVGDPLLLGDARLVVARVLTLEPDRGAGFLTLAPRVLMHRGDLEATALVQPASRVTWRLAAAGADAAVARYAGWAQRQLREGGVRGLRFETLESGQPQLRQTLERAGQFLRLVALLSALLAAVAVALAARDFARRHLDDCALLRVLGLGQATIARSYAAEFLLVGLAASVLGVALGWAAHFGFVRLLAGLVAADLPAAGWRPVAFGLGLGLTLLVAFGLPPVLRLARVPPLRVLRRDLGPPRAGAWAVLALGVGGFAALLLAAAGSARLGAIVVGGFVAAALCFAALAWLAVRLLRGAVREASAPAWLALATRQVAARPVYAVLQVSALAIGLLALVLLVLLRTDLLAGWRAATPADAPDRFVLDIQAAQADAFRAALGAAGVAAFDFYPMARGRLVAVNDRAVRGADYADERAARMVEREFNLSRAAALPAHNAVVAGRWRADEPGAVSLEEGIARTLGVRLGDRLAFDVAGVVHEARVASLRKVEWGSMHANFFVLYPDAAWPADAPVTYLAAYRAPAGGAASALERVLAQQFPGATRVDLGATLAQVQRVLDQVVRAVEWLFAFALATGLVVLAAAITATREERAREFAVMRALGASARLLARVQRAELLGLGLLAGLLAGAVALVVGWALARWVFGFAWTAPAWVPLASAAAGAALAWAAGWWGLRGVLRRPVVQTLRQAAQ